ncbi:hypothetical protein VKT23_018010 [Stygiomarasmius scandens]|uniref:Uncharacterized protein n=1 Tax=Marasmiellus scandens TaxID=2682957 RepID=A0ABR1IQ72_9AGAR
MSRTNIESRERRAWSTQEDRLLLEAVNKEDPGNPCPSRWSAIATHIPNRTNKDCRKRWFAHFATDIIKGAWTPEEDSRLIEAMDKYGPKWSKIAAVVKTRNSDQCAKRWKDTLDPTIDRTNWSAEADETLMRAVQEHGRLWTKIVNLYFPGKTGLAAKNRYNSLLALAKKTRNPSAYSAQPLYANAAPGATPGFTSSMSFTPSIPIANLLSDTSYFDRAACPATSPTSTVASRGLPVPVHTRMAYSAMIRQQQSSKLASVIPNPTSSDSVFAGYAGHTLDSYIGPFNPAALTSTNQQDHFFDMTAASSPETDNDTIDNFDMQACMNTISILSASPSASTSSVSSPMSNHSKVPPLVHSSSSSSSDSSTSSVSTGLFDAYNSSGRGTRFSHNSSYYSSYGKDEPVQQLYA